MDWNDLRYFLGVARSGSLTQTSVDLRVSQSTVSRRIAELEASMGMVLFARHQTGYSLTDDGREVLKHAELVEDSVLSLEREAAGLEKTPVGAVRLATSESLATDLIIPAMPALRDQYPGICLEIITSTAITDLGRHEGDIALRVARPTRAHLKFRRVGHMDYSVYGSRDYLSRHPIVDGEPMGGRQFIAWDDNHSHLPAATWLVREHPGCRIAMVTNGLPAQIAAVRAGLGLAIIPDFLAVKDDLVRVVPADQVFSNELWLVTHADFIASARVRAVSDFLADQVVRMNPDLASRA